METTKELQDELRTQINSLGLKLDVSGCGPIDAEIVVIAEAPGETEKQLGLPLVGGSGKYLWDALRKIGVSRQQCYITNVVKRQLAISNSAKVKAKIQKNELNLWQGLLRQELDYLKNPRYILCLGGYALEAVTGHTGIKKFRGSVFESEGIFKGYRGKSWVVCTYNPANVYHDPKIEFHFRFDIGKLRQCIRGEFKQHEILAHINPSFDQAIGFLKSLDDASLPISFDIEVIGRQTACIGFANNAHEGMCINFRDLETSRYSVDQEMKLRLSVARLIAKNSDKLVAQNGSFDSYWLEYHDRIQVPKVWFDTLLAHHALYPTFPHSLGFLTTQYTNHPFYKDEKDEWRHVGDINKFWEYNVKDACITRAVQQKLHEELRQANMEEFFFNHVMRLQPHLVKMTLAGVRADLSVKEQVSIDLAADLVKHKNAFYKAVKAATGDEKYEPNPHSPPQMRDLYFNRLRLVGRGTSVDKENRDRFLAHPLTSEAAKEVINTQSIFIKEHKFYSTYATMAVHPDGQIRCDYKQYGVQSAPGRLSSASTLDGYGTNLQNQPDRAKKFFIAEPGWCFVYYDLSQAEARVVSVAWNVAGLKEAFARAEVEKGFDVHRANAARMFQLPLEQIPLVDYDENGEKTMRYFGKRGVHGLNYTMQPPTFAERNGIPLSSAYRAYRLYHLAFPEVSKAWPIITQTARKQGELYNPFGRKWKLLQRYSEDAMESIIAFYPQSTIGDKVSQTIYQCHEDVEWPHGASLIVMNIHDALIAKCRIEHREKVGSIMRRYAETPIPITDLWGNLHMVKIPCELAYSEPDEQGVHRWSTLKKVK